jgi:23S rRNA U2552 (ribose-2'-O)-methylase RlmE/FtsJ
MKSIIDIATKSSHKPLFKLEHYFDVYHRYFSKYRNTPVRILEIGVCDGGSLDLWREYFGDDARIFGVDINPAVTRFTSHNIQIIIANQEDKELLTDIFSNQPPFDIIIDDGGHMPNQQKNSFEILFPLLHMDGVYIVEDIQTSYWKSFDGGLRMPNTFIEFSKKLIDYVNVDHFRGEDDLLLDETLKKSLKEQLTGVNFYDGMVVFTKGDKTPKLPIHYYGNDRIEIDTLSNFN